MPACPTSALYCATDMDGPGDPTLFAKLVRRISLLKLPLINIYAYRIGEPGVLLFSLSNESPVDLRTYCEHITKTKLRNQCL